MLDWNRFEEGEITMVIVCNGNVYEGSQKVVDVLVEVAKDKVRGGGFCIVAVQNEGMVEMKKDYFTTKVALYERKKEYEDAGFTVYLVDRGLLK